MIEVEFEWYLKEKMYPNVRSTTFLLGDFGVYEQNYEKQLVQISRFETA